MTIGLNNDDDLVKVMNIFSSKDPEKKISAMAAMENSQKNSKNIEMDYIENKEDSTQKKKTFDLKYCLWYGYIKPSFKYVGKDPCICYNTYILSPFNKY